jgi:sulfatase modifying factor 1
MENLSMVISGQTLELAFVAGTGHEPFLFGDEQPVLLPDFYIATTQTTQALWEAVMGENPSLYPGDDLPVEQVSWYQVQDFIGKISRDFRLPTEAEWEYAARGGKHWRDGFRFAGSNDMMVSGWFEGNAGPYTDLAAISKLKNQAKLTKTHPVAQKKPNQLGLYDMNGNLWEWCQDWFVRDTHLIPKDGSAYGIPGEAKVLRGGCHHNGAIHCTNTMRYEIGPQFFDGCIGFRVALTLKP